MSSDIRRTKIIATLGPATESEADLEKLILSGVDIARLNMAHATHDWTRMIIRRLRAVSAKVERDIAIMMDIKGPEIRTGDVTEPITLNRDDLFDFTVRPDIERHDAEGIRAVDVNYPQLPNDINIGDTVLVDNGLITFEVLEKHGAYFRCRVIIPGELKSRRHINLPGVTVNLPSFTEKDRGDTTIGLEEGIDFVALSFVRSPDDITQLREFLTEQKSKVRIIAKIEDQSGITNLDAIVRSSDALMVARGDLGIECPFEELPIIQRRAVRSCLAHGRPVIVATHMLESMITQPLLSRYDDHRDAHGVEQLADCVMLSGETTIGRYPAKCVDILSKIARRIELEEDTVEGQIAVFTGERMKILHSAVVLANQIPDSKILTFTRHGFMAHGLAAQRPSRAPILTFTPHQQLFRQLRLLRSVEPYLMPFASEPDATIENAIAHLKRLQRIQVGDKLIIATDILSQDRLIDSVQLRTVH